MGERSAGENLRKRFVRDGNLREIRRLKVILVVNQFSIRLINPGGVRVIALHRLFVDVFIEPLFVGVFDGLDHLVPIGVIFGKSFQGFAVMLKKFLEGLIPLFATLFRDAPKFRPIVKAEGPEPGHERRHHQKEEERDFSLNFHRIASGPQPLHKKIERDSL